MKILLAHNSLYYPAHGGGDRSNRLLMEALAERGHHCRVIARTADYGPKAQEALVRDLAARGVPALSSGAGVVLIRRNGVEVHTVANHPNLRAYFAVQSASFQPDITIASTDDPAQVLLEAALRQEGSRIVYLARAILPLPFGPDCAFPSLAKTAALRQVDALIGVSRYVSNYVQRHSGIPSVHVPISLLEPGDYPVCGRFENEFITMVNPSATKGISIFLALARALPLLRFAAVPTWGTSAGDLAEMREAGNITILDPVDDIKDILNRTRVMLIPSLWAEARSRMVIESLVHGVPVIASDVGGLGEAMMGVPYVLPVNPITRYHSRVDENMVPVAEIPSQDTSEWARTLERLGGDRAHWEEVAGHSRKEGLRYASELTAGPFEEVLGQVLRTPVRRVSTPEKAPLSPEKQKLLAMRLKKKAAALGNPWFPVIPDTPDSGVRLFCFPFAGGGSAFFRGWPVALGSGISPVPVVLPGRERRLNEKAVENFERLADLIQEAIASHLDMPFAFFGHSMGAVLAFEVARRLRRDGQPLPAALLVSGARAPQCRRGHVPPPDPSDAELMEQLRSVQAPGASLPDQPELMRLLLPALRADTKAYRGYVYPEGDPFAAPIFAYGGKEDPQVSTTHLEGWREQTTKGFSLRTFPGGHFFLRSNALLFLSAVKEDLSAIPKRAAASLP